MPHYLQQTLHTILVVALTACQHLPAQHTAQYQLADLSFTRPPLRGFVPSHMDVNEDIDILLESGADDLGCSASAGLRETTYTTIEGHAVCFEQINDHAAGNAYYKTYLEIVTDDGVLSASWVLHETSCGPLYDNYEDAQKCENEHHVARELFSPLHVAEILLMAK